MREHESSHGRGRVGCGGLLMIPAGLFTGAVLGIAGGSSCSVEVAGTNITLGVAFGDKTNVTDTSDGVLPDYLIERLGKDNNFINQTQRLTIWRFESVGAIIVGKQENAPAIDLKIDIDK